MANNIGKQALPMDDKVLDDIEAHIELLMGVCPDQFTEREEYDEQNVVPELRIKFERTFCVKEHVASGVGLVLFIHWFI